MTTKITLNSIKDVQNFVNLVNKYDFDIDLISDRYVIDAKSIMGIYSLDLTKPITVHAHTEENAEFLAELAPFIVE